jgi:Zn-dependent protease
MAILARPILFALTVHEASHALVAYWRGDPTAKMLGRLTLNPLKHLDPMGTLVFFITAMAGAGIGWAKPVPVEPATSRTRGRTICGSPRPGR